MEDLINTVLEGIYDVIYSVMELVLDSFVGRLLYYAETGLCKIVGMLDQMFQVFAGITKVSYDGEKDYLVNIFFNNRSISNVYWGMALIGIAMAFGFTIAAVVRKLFDSSGKVQQSHGQIITSLLQTMFLILGMSAIMVIVLNSTNVLMQQINYVFNDPENLDLEETIVYTDEEFAAMGRVLKTIGNFSLNPSYSSHYNINICYNEIRQDLYYLQQQKVFRYYYTTTDADGNTVNTWQSVLQKIANSHDPRSDLMIDVSYDAVTKSMLEAMDIIRNDPGFKPLQSYSRVMPAEGLLPLDRYLFLMGTMHAAKNSDYNTKAELTDPVRGPYYSGEKSIYSISQVSSDFDIGFATDYLVVFVSGIALIFDLVIIILNCIARIFNMLFLYLIAPPIFATRPLDSGGKTKQWLTAFVVQAFSVFGTVIAMRLLLILLPIVTSSRLVLFENSMLNAMAKLVLIYGLFEVSKKATGLFTGILADSAGWQSVQAGDMSATANRLVGGVAGAAMSLGRTALRGAGAVADFATKPVQNVAKRGLNATVGKAAQRWSTLGMGLEDNATAKAKERLAEEQAYAKLTGGGGAAGGSSGGGPGGSGGNGGGSLPSSGGGGAGMADSGGSGYVKKTAPHLPASLQSRAGVSRGQPASNAQSRAGASGGQSASRAQSRTGAPGGQGGSREAPNPTQRPHIDGAGGKSTNMHDVMGVPRSQTNAAGNPNKSASGANEAPASMGARPTLDGDRGQTSSRAVPPPSRAPEAPQSDNASATDGGLPQNLSGEANGPRPFEPSGESGPSSDDRSAGMTGADELPQNQSGMGDSPASFEQPGDVGGAGYGGESTADLPQNQSGMGDSPASFEQPGDMGGAGYGGESTADLPQNQSGMSGSFAEGGYGSELTAAGNVELGDAGSRPTIEPAPTPSRYAQDAPQSSNRPTLDHDDQSSSAQSAQDSTAPTPQARPSVPQQPAQASVTPPTPQARPSAPQQLAQASTTSSTSQARQSAPQQATRSSTTPSTQQTRQSVPQQSTQAGVTPPTSQARQSAPQQATRSSTAPSTPQARQSAPQQSTRSSAAPSTQQTRQSVPQQPVQASVTPSTPQTRQSAPQQSARSSAAPPTQQTRQSVPQQPAQASVTPSTPQTRQSAPQQSAQASVTPPELQTRQSAPQQSVQTSVTPPTPQARPSAPQQSAQSNVTSPTPQQSAQTVVTPPTPQTRPSVPRPQNSQDTPPQGSGLPDNQNRK